MNSATDDSNKKNNIEISQNEDEEEIEDLKLSETDGLGDGDQTPDTLDISSDHIKHSVGSPDSDSKLSHGNLISDIKLSPGSLNSDIKLSPGSPNSDIKLSPGSLSKGIIISPESSSTPITDTKQSHDNIIKESEPIPKSPSIEHKQSPEIPYSPTDDVNFDRQTSIEASSDIDISSDVNGSSPNSPGNSSGVNIIGGENSSPGSPSKSSGDGYTCPESPYITSGDIKLDYGGHVIKNGDHKNGNRVVSPEDLLETIDIRQFCDSKNSQSSSVTTSSIKNESCDDEDDDETDDSDDDEFALETKFMVLTFMGMVPIAPGELDSSRSSSESLGRRLGYGESGLSHLPALKEGYMVRKFDQEDPSFYDEEESGELGRPEAQVGFGRSPENDSEGRETYSEMRSRGFSFKDDRQFADQFKMLKPPLVAKDRSSPITDDDDDIYLGSVRPGQRMGEFTSSNALITTPSEEERIATREQIRKMSKKMSITKQATIGHDSPDFMVGGPFDRSPHKEIDAQTSGTPIISPPRRQMSRSPRKDTDMIRSHRKESDHESPMNRSPRKDGVDHTHITSGTPIIRPKRPDSIQLTRRHSGRLNRSGSERIASHILHKAKTIEISDIAKKRESFKRQLEMRQDSNMSNESDLSDVNSFVNSIRSYTSNKSSFIDVQTLDYDVIEKVDEIPEFSIVEPLKNEIEEELEKLEKKIEMVSVKAGTPVSDVVSIHSPETAVAQYLGVLGDKINEDIERMIGNCSQQVLNAPGKITYSVLKAGAEMVLQETDENASGWSKVAAIMTFGRMVTHGLVAKSGKGVKKLVNLTSRLVTDYAADFIVQNGGWGALTDLELESPAFHRLNTSGLLRGDSISPNPLLSPLITPPDGTDGPSSMGFEVTGFLGSDSNTLSGDDSAATYKPFGTSKDTSLNSISSLNEDTTGIIVSATGAEPVFGEGNDSENAGRVGKDNTLKSSNTLDNITEITPEISDPSDNNNSSGNSRKTELNESNEWSIEQLTASGLDNLRTDIKYISQVSEEYCMEKDRERRWSNVVHYVGVATVVACAAVCLSLWIRGQFKKT